MEEVIPWPVSLGIAGGSIVALVTLLVWLIKQFASGKFRTGAEFERAEERQNAVVTALETGHAKVIDALRESHANALEAEKRRADEQVANQTVRGNEWKETALIERDGREKMTEVAKTAVDTFDKLVSKSPTSGDNGVEEVPR